ncbi:MAG: hypothetical protein H7Y61_08930, partial [Rhizobiales bacterium]|nr:hypothetical protein [Rhizobacter sp.]
TYGYNVKAFRRADADGTVRNLIAVWRKVDALPRATTEAVIDINCSNFHFPRAAAVPSLRPRLTDMLDGRVYGLRTPGTLVLNDAVANRVQLRGIPAPDYPVLVSDQGIVQLQ